MPAYSYLHPMDFLKYLPGLETAKDLAMKPVNWLKQKGSEILHGTTDRVISGVQDATRLTLSGILKGIMSIPVILMKESRHKHK